ncbi:hypothetical protein MBLNU230_g1410t1 [Neophaeotheca triangularis]
MLAPHATTAPTTDAPPQQPVPNKRRLKASTTLLKRLMAEAIVSHQLPQTTQAVLPQPFPSRPRVQKESQSQGQVTKSQELQTTSDPSASPPPHGSALTFRRPYTSPPRTQLQVNPQPPNPTLSHATSTPKWPRNPSDPNAPPQQLGSEEEKRKGPCAAWLGSRETNTAFHQITGSGERSG